MSTLQEIINSLYVLCGTILLTTGYLLYRAMDLKKKTINPMFWFAAFSGLYLAVGGLRTLLSTEPQSLEELFWKYKIDVSTVENCYLPWLTFFSVIIFIEYLAPGKADIQEVIDFFESKNISFLFKVLSCILVPTVLFAFFSGGIGYMGQTVGTDRSSYEINPFYSIIYLVLIALLPLIGVYILFSPSNVLVLFSFMLMTLVSVSLGRRTIFSLMLAIGTVSFIKDPSAIKRPYFILLVALFFILMSYAFTFFYGLRIASFELSSYQKERSFVLLAPKALEHAFSVDSLVAKDFKEQEKQNTSERPFGPMGFYISVVNLFKNTYGFHGELVISNFKSVIPRFFYPEKDKMLERSFEEETFVARFQSIPSIGDEAPTFLVSAIINFGLPGILLLAFVYKIIISLVLWIAKMSKSRLLYCMVVSLLLVQLQWGETNSAMLFETLRFVALLSLPFFILHFLYSNENFLSRTT